MSLLRKYYYGENRAGPYFEGWYFKCQTKEGRAIALIPALHIDAKNRRSVSLQVITDSGAWWLEYPNEAFSASPRRLWVQVGSNIFLDSEMRLEIEQPGISLRGKLDFGLFTPLKSDIMGPFRFLPNMECSHGVISMTHSLQGKLTLNGEVYDFTGGKGYIETDRGCAFPDAYLWAQCSWPHGSLMLSIATIPYAGICFKGCICAVIHDGKEYRLATYRGVRVKHWANNGAAIQQGKYRLEVEVLEEQPQMLRAPVNGQMRRAISESLCAKLRCRFWVGDTLVFDQVNCNGSFEHSIIQADKPV